MNRAARRLSRRRIGGLAGMSLVATTGLLGAYLGNPRMPRAYAAATCTVTTAADSGPGSFRQALTDHDLTDANCSTINFAPSISTITLSSNLPTVAASSLTITGPGSDLLTVDFNGRQGIAFSTTAGQNLSISGLTLTRGTPAVYVLSSDVQISDVTFTSNSFLSGAAIFSFNGQIDISNSTFTSNTATVNFGGGAVSQFGAGRVEVAYSTFTNNTASAGPGGAIRATVAANISYSTFSGNTATSGGAISGGNIALTNSTVTANSATGAGGGVDAAGSVTANFSTFSANSAGVGQARSINAVSTYTVANSIFNETGTALSGAGGSAATFSFFNSSSALTNNSGAGLVFATTSGVAPLSLGGLANNGGATQTMLPGAGSPVIAAANPASTTPALDQRGFARSSPSNMGSVDSSGVRPVADTSQLPPSWFQATMRQTPNETCPSDSNPSWATWPNKGTGGWTCEKTTWWDVNKGFSGGWVTTPGLRSLKKHASKAYFSR
jgi:predicted outer membrane repeat protein